MSDEKPKLGRPRTVSEEGTWRPLTTRLGEAHYVELDAIKAEEEDVRNDSEAVRMLIDDSRHNRADRR